MRACLIGEKLGHSFSREIHEKFGAHYDLVELSEDKLENFVRSRSYACFNVTIPYKQKIAKYLDCLDVSAQEVGCVNTVVEKDGKLVGYNTDIDGLEFLFARSGVCAKGKHAVVLGSGGASKTACALLKRQGAASVTVVGRNRPFNYSNYHNLVQTQLLVNATPVGMYPDCENRPVDLQKFPNLQFVADVIYNPLKTPLLLQAERLGLPCANGLSMLVFQAVRAEEIWQEKSFADVAESVLEEIERRFCNVVLVGMPSCGKTSVGKALAKMLGKTFVDLDEEAEKAEDCCVSQIFRQKGEQYFRTLETDVACRIGKKNGLVIATGGGVVLKRQNVDALRQNGFVVWLQRDLQNLCTENRPVSQSKGVQKIFEERKDLYALSADVAVFNDDSVEKVAEKVKDAFLKSTQHHLPY